MDAVTPPAETIKSFDSVMIDIDTKASGPCVFKSSVQYFKVIAKNSRGKVYKIKFQYYKAILKPGRWIFDSKWNNILQTGDDGSIAVVLN